MLTNLPPSVSGLSRQCGILNISSPCRPPRPVIDIDFFIYGGCSYLTGNTCGPPGHFTGKAFTLLYVDGVCTSQEAYVSTASYGDSFTFVYVDDVRTSEERYLWAPTAYYGDSFTY
jgi:hypothetical protein